MAHTAQQAYNEISAHIQKQGGSCSSWYCGITHDINERLFGDHKVPKKDHWYAYRECISDNEARKVEKSLVADGCDGGTGGGNAYSIFVYAYLKTSKTTP